MVPWLIGKVKLTAEKGIVFALSLVVLAISVYISTVKPAPYKNVDLVASEFIDGEYHVIANFEKTACVFERLTVLGSSLGTTEFLDYRNTGLDVGKQYDRDAGDQTLRIAIKLKRNFYDWIEIRTRHDCEGELVDRIFLHLDEVP